MCVQNERCVGERDLERERERGVGIEARQIAYVLGKETCSWQRSCLREGEFVILYNKQFLVTGNDFLAKVLRPLLATVLVTTAP